LRAGCGRGQTPTHLARTTGGIQGFVAGNRLTVAKKTTRAGQRAPPRRFRQTLSATILSGLFLAGSSVPEGSASMPTSFAWAFLAAPSVRDTIARNLFDDTFANVHQMAWFDWAMLIPYFTVLII